MIASASEVERRHETVGVPCHDRLRQQLEGVREVENSGHLQGVAA